MKTRYSYRTRVGVFAIVFERGRWHVLFEDEPLGSYATATQALDDLVGGSTYWPSCGNPSQFSLPDDLSDWS